MGQERRQRLAADPSSAPPALSCRQLPPPALRSRGCRGRLPCGIRLLQSMSGSSCPSNAPILSGAGVAPPPWPKLGRRWQKSGLFPPKSQPRSAFKGPAAQLGLLVVRWGWGWGLCFQNSPQRDAQPPQLIRQVSVGSQTALPGVGLGCFCCPPGCRQNPVPFPRALSFHPGSAWRQRRLQGQG